MEANMRFGSQAAKKGDIAPERAKTRENSMNTIYVNVMAIPMPRCNPMPPLTLRLDKAAPMKVKMIMAAGEARRFYISIS